MSCIERLKNNWNYTRGKSLRHESSSFIYINKYIYALQGDSDLAEIDYANTFQKKWLICSSMNMRNTL